MAKFQPFTAKCARRSSSKKKGIFGYKPVIGNHHDSCLRRKWKEEADEERVILKENYKDRKESTLETLSNLFTLSGDDSTKSFLLSLKIYLETNGYLTEKQDKALMKIVNKSDNNKSQDV
jgi:hypothetical protein